MRQRLLSKVLHHGGGPSASIKPKFICQYHTFDDYAKQGGLFSETEESFPVI